jgi:hypothetical protein
MERQDLMITEFALSTVAALLILQSMFLLRVAMTSAEESSDMRLSTQTERIAVVDPVPSHARNSSSHATATTK